MSLKKPYKRTYRMFTKERIEKGGIRDFIRHHHYSDSPEHYVRAYLLIQKDFLSLLDYIEPSDQNIKTYSFRIHELLLRICIEIESNFVAILKENGYKKKGDWNIVDYRKINTSHRLSSYEVIMPVWNGSKNCRMPFKNWETDGKLAWWKVYNETKHSRHSNFSKATFEHLTDAICALITILSAQFADIEFSPDDWNLIIGGPDDGSEVAIGKYFCIRYPTEWTDQEKYDFDWEEIGKQKNPISQFKYK